MISKTRRNIVVEDLLKSQKKMKPQSSPRSHAGRLSHQEKSHWLAEAAGGGPSGLIPSWKNATLGAAPKCRNFMARNSKKSTT